MRVIVGCEFSQIVTTAFRKHGHEAYSCDLIPTEGQHPEWHYQMDILELLKREQFDLGIFHPPCIRLANSGVQWLERRNLWDEMDRAIDFFLELQSANIPRIAIENPIQHKYARLRIRKYDQIIQPWMFGHGETKATCLWLKELPKLKPTNVVEGRDHNIHKMPGNKDRVKNRNRTFQGVADAMALQWSF